jgi:hypothetical protein
MSLSADSITDQIRDRIIGVLRKDTTPVNNNVVNEVADEVTNEIAPVVINASNAEAWFQSRIYIGLLTAGIGAVAQHFGVQISGSDIQVITNNIPELVQLVGSIMEVGGILLATIGRIKGSSWKPLFSHK